jgi:DNA-binding MarR family transcriptional regulator
MNIMPYTVQIMNTPDKEQSLTLEILETIDNKSDVTQRHLADSLGVALGLANSYLKRCVRKGLIKIEQAPANRYLYYLTPRGFAEKSRLTAEYLSASFDFYRRASASCTNVLQKCREQHYKTVLLCGISELAEIASLRASEQGIRIAGVLDRDSRLHEFVGIPVRTALDGDRDFDACILTAINAPADLLAIIEKQVEKDRILIPDILGIKN